ncbi:hypothetical protein X777_04292 [Ooceraea biroi]|uniref:THAP-type domain-containing protein n=1 Tax=Ooceraea biroi TaxID=2015173 RepID=A0A026WI17_OOCBI|nr:hypothetical protein X777_04292 [Ooceraea biroi]
MTGCSADYCTNSSTKGFQMCRFPQDIKRRKLWMDNVNRSDWVPGSSSCLCHVCTGWGKIIGQAFAS